MLAQDPTKVYYQDPYAYPFHAGFATERLDPFMGMSREAYDQVSLHAQGQQAILGVVLVPRDPETTLEYGIQLVRQDAYDPQTALSLLNLVKSSIVEPAGMQAFYFPTVEQEASAVANRDFFAANGFPVSWPDRWVPGDGCYANGWALGRVRYVPTDMIDEAYAQGQLLAEDILLTEGVPAEIPLVAGVLSLTPSTPSSHVALLSTSFGTPFAFLEGAEIAQRAMALDGQEAALRVLMDDNHFCQVTLAGTEGEITAADRQQLLALKEPVDLGIQPKEALGSYVGSTDDLGPADLVHFGGKAANYGLLRDAIPQNSDVAIALSFDLWDDFLDQGMPGGSTLRQEIEATLGGYTYPPDLQALWADLAALRARITEDTVFTPAQEQAVIAALAPFTPTQKIRFRSSTNVEDSALFTGAGLYDSYSGCLADDTDADAAGPSLCDADEAGERGVFRALRKVYASFYNDNAFLARLRHGVNEAEVGMGVLVHHSYPDAQEMANGVATLSHGFPSLVPLLEMVTQVGATSVTNPEGGALPEAVRVYNFGSLYFQRRSWSSLLPLGENVMQWSGDYGALAGLLWQVRDRFMQVYPDKPSFQLDVEFKKMAPGELLVKQVREVAQGDTTPSLTPYLLDDPRELCTVSAQGSGTVFTAHRLKARATLSTKSTFLTPAVLETTLFKDVDLKVAPAGSVVALSGSPAAWPGAAHTVAPESATDTFTVGAGAGLTTFTLTASGVKSLLPRSRGPLVAPSDHALRLSATYATPRTSYGCVSYDGTPYNGIPFDCDEVVHYQVPEESIALAACPGSGPPDPGATLVEDTCVLQGGVTIAPSLYWPPGDWSNDRAPLHRWPTTEITGLTSSPIVLTGHFSQTYWPSRHNDHDAYIFEPRLEEGLDPALIAELEAQGIHAIYMQVIYARQDVWTIDAAGDFHHVQGAVGQSYSCQWP